MFSGMIQILVLFVETAHEFITAKLSIHKAGSSSVLNLRGVSTNKTINYSIICFIAMQTYKELMIQIVEKNNIYA